MKDQVAEVIAEKSLMPKVEASAGERRDLLAYLSSLNAGLKTGPMPGRTETESGIPFSKIAHPKPGAWPTYHGNESGNRFSHERVHGPERCSRHR